MNLAEQTYWDSLYTETELEPVSKDNPIRRWIEDYLPAVPQGENKTCLEIGCFPGRYLSVFGERGYEVHGFDLTPRVRELPAWFSLQGLKVGQFTQQDVSDVSFIRQYDVVCSFGFIEHFTNWIEIIDVHSKLVKSGGYLVIEVPNFSGIVQKILHKSLDMENLKRHYLESMDPDRWRSILEKKNFQVQFGGYMGEFDFWAEDQKRNGIQKKLLHIIYNNKGKLKSILKNSSRHYSPYCGIVARKM